MLRSILKSYASFSLYQGIPPSLLASISMSQNLKATTQDQLVDELIKRNIFKKGPVETVARTVDRAWFTTSSNPYDDCPKSISKGQLMTSPLVQLLSLRILYQNSQEILKKQKLKILDIGCGHGYMSFAMHRLFSASNRKCETLGIDIWNQCTTQAQNINKTNFKIDNIKFKPLNIDNVETQNFDVVYCGFYVRDSLHEKLISLMDNRQSVGVWPISSQGQQRLHVWKKSNGQLSKQYIMTSMFTKQRTQINDKIKKYFVQYQKDGEQQQNIASINQSSSKQSQQQQIIRIKKNVQKQKARLKQWQQEFKKNTSRVPTLSDMRANQQISQILEVIRKANR